MHHLFQCPSHRSRVFGSLLLRSLSQSLLKLQDIKGPGGILVRWQPLQGVIVGMEELVDIRERLPQLIQ